LVFVRKNMRQAITLEYYISCSLERGTLVLALETTQVVEYSSTAEYLLQYSVRACVLFAPPCPFSLLLWAHSLAPWAGMDDSKKDNLKNYKRYDLRQTNDKF